MVLEPIEALFLVTYDGIPDLISTLNTHLLREWGKLVIDPTIPTCLLNLDGLNEQSDVCDELGLHFPAIHVTSLFARHLLEALRYKSITRLSFFLIQTSPLPQNLKSKQNTFAGIVQLLVSTTIERIFQTNRIKMKFLTLLLLFIAIVAS